jgi:hypothetical protein
MGATSFNSPGRPVQVFAENLERYLNGEPLLNPVDKSAGY